MTRPRHDWLHVALALWALAVLAGAPLWCAEAPAWEVSCGVRATDSSGLGYTAPGSGAWCWRDHRGEVWTVRTEVLATTADKSGPSDWAGVVLVEERRRIRDGRFWWGVGTEWTWTDAESAWSDRLFVSAGFSDETTEGHGQAVTLRLMGPDSTEYEAHGAVLRWESLYPRWRIVAEGSEWAFELPDGQRSWGRRFAVLVGYRWRQQPVAWGEWQ